MDRLEVHPGLVATICKKGLGLKQKTNKTQHVGELCVCQNHRTLKFAVLRRKESEAKEVGRRETMKKKKKKKKKQETNVMISLYFRCIGISHKKPSKA